MSDFEYATVSPIQGMRKEDKGDYGAPCSVDKKCSDGMFCRNGVCYESLTQPLNHFYFTPLNNNGVISASTTEWSNYERAKQK